MLDDQRPGTAYWIDHYVVGSDDLDRWADFQTRVIGAKPQVGPPRGIVFQDLTHCCHHGAMKGSEPLAPSAGLGKGLPRYGLFIRQSEIDEHLRRLDKLNVPHLDPARTSAEGDDGISIAYEDPDGNQFEFWAPDRLPPGAMAGETELKVGRISHGVFECKDLKRAADHFHTHGKLEPMVSADIPSDTLVLPLVGGARIVYKQVETIGRRTGGWGILHAAHAALVMREQDFWPAYDYMWDTVPEWKWDPQTRQFVGAGPELPARTSRHGSPGGVAWFDIKGRGDDWYDWDANCFHFMGGAPINDSLVEYVPHTMDWYFPQYLKDHGLTAPPVSR